MPRRTAESRRIERLLADFDALNREARKLTKEADEMKERIRAEVAPGTYGDVMFSYGTPREMLDQPGVRKDYADRGVDVPTVMSKPPLVISHVSATKTTK